MPNSELIPTAEAAKVLGCNVRTIHRFVTSGKLTPAQKFPGYRGPYLFRRADVEALIRTESAA